MVSLIQNNQNAISPFCPFGADFYHCFFLLYILNTGLGIFLFLSVSLGVISRQPTFHLFNGNIATLGSMHGDQIDVLQDIMVSTLYKLNILIFGEQFFALHALFIVKSSALKPPLLISSPLNSLILLVFFFLAANTTFPKLFFSIVSSWSVPTRGWFVLRKKSQNFSHRRIPLFNTKSSMIWTQYRLGSFATLQQLSEPSNLLQQNHPPQ